MAQRLARLKRDNAGRDLRQRAPLLAFAIVAFMFSECVMFGQQAANVPIDVDDPELYFGFLAFQVAIQRDILNASDAPSAEEFRQAVARQFNISEADLAILQRVARSTLDAISDATSNHRAYLSKEVAAGRKPDAKVLASFQTRRVELLKTGADNLRQTMSPAGWQAVRSYINGEYRSGIVRKEVTVGK